MTVVFAPQNRTAIGRFAAQRFSAPEIPDLVDATPTELITAMIADGCPDAQGWSMDAVDCHGGHVFVGPINVEFDGGSVTFEPHIHDDRGYHELLAELTREQGERRIRIALR